MKIDVTFSKTSMEFPITLSKDSTDIPVELSGAVIVPSVGDHTKLLNRDAADQHPIGSITKLQTELDGKLESAGFLTNMEIQAILNS